MDVVHYNKHLDQNYLNKGKQFTRSGPDTTEPFSLTIERFASSLHVVPPSGVLEHIYHYFADTIRDHFPDTELTARVLDYEMRRAPSIPIPDDKKALNLDFLALLIPQWQLCVNDVPEEDESANNGDDQPQGRNDSPARTMIQTPPSLGRTPLEQSVPLPTPEPQTPNYFGLGMDVDQVGGPSSYFASVSPPIPTSSPLRNSLEASSSSPVLWNGSTSAGKSPRRTTTRKELTFIHSASSSRHQVQVDSSSSTGPDHRGGRKSSSTSKPQQLPKQKGKRKQDQVPLEPEPECTVDSTTPRPRAKRTRH